MLASKSQLNLYKLASKDSTREVLQTVRFTVEDEQTVATVTDGYIAMRIKEDNGDVKDYPADMHGNSYGDASRELVPASVLKKALANLPKSTIVKTLPILNNALVGGAVVTTTDLSHVDQVRYKGTQDMKYPDNVDEFFKPEEGASMKLINPKYLIEVLSHFEDSVELYIGDDKLKPLYIKSGNKEAVIMPLKG